MDNRLLIGFSVFLALFLAFPFVAQVLRGDNSSNSTAGESRSTTASVDPAMDQPPLLNAQNLVGTEWRVRAEGFEIKVTIAANGVCYATHPLLKSMTGLDYVEGRWRVEYDKAYIEAQFGNQRFNEVLTIRGHNLYSGDRRVERY